MKNAFAAKAANQNDTVLMDLERQLKAMARGQQQTQKEAPKKAAAQPAAATVADKSDQRDGLLGSLLFNCLFGVPLGDVFSEAAEHLPDAGDPALTAGMAVDMYDEFRQDRENAKGAKNNRTNDRGVDTGVKGSSVNGMFNRLGAGALPDAPQRLNLADHHAVIARMKRAPGFYMAA
jgi:hypothetical protein